MKNYAPGKRNKRKSTLRFDPNVKASLLHINYIQIILKFLKKSSISPHPHYKKPYNLDNNLSEKKR